jgi:hypothetical protein
MRDEFFPSWLEPAAIGSFSTFQLDSPFRFSPLKAPMEGLTLEPAAFEFAFDDLFSTPKRVRPSIAGQPMCFRFPAGHPLSGNAAIQLHPPSPPHPLPLPEDFSDLSHDSDHLVNPKGLGFIPSSFWTEGDFTLGHIVESFFQKRNTANCRFSHKLFNALRLSTAFPELARHIGVEWITQTVLRVDKFVFARLLKIKAIDGSLFHQQGNFPSHGFVELSENDARADCPSNLLVGVDYEAVRLLRHQDGVITRDCTSKDIENCRWVNAKKRATATSA